MFLARGATYPGIPSGFAYPAAFGDLLAVMLALAAISALLKNSNSSFTLVWIFNIEGSLDLLAAITLAVIYDASLYMGSGFSGNTLSYFHYSA